MTALTISVADVVSDACNQFERDTGIQISDNTREIITAILRAISEDPHPAWQVDADSNKLALLTQAYTSAIPMMLYQVINSERVGDRVGAFDFLHWFSKYFETMLCIIPK